MSSTYSQQQKWGFKCGMEHLTVGFHSLREQRHLMQHNTENKLEGDHGDCAGCQDVGCGCQTPPSQHLIGHTYL